RASEPVEVATAQITGPAPRHLRVSLGLEPILSMPLRGYDVSDAEVGINAGAAITAMEHPAIGFAMDFMYHDWPTSNSFKERFNDLFRRATLNTLQLGGIGWRIHVLQATGGIKVTAPSGPVRPWAKAEAGFYRIDPRTIGFEGDAGFFQVRIGP